SHITTSSNNSRPRTMSSNGCGYHTRKISAAAMAASKAVAMKWIPKASSLSRHTLAMGPSVVAAYAPAQPLGVLGARLGFEPALFRSARRLRRDALLRRDQRAQQQVAQP